MGDAPAEGQQPQASDQEPQAEVPPQEETADESVAAPADVPQAPPPPRYQG